MASGAISHWSPDEYSQASPVEADRSNVSPPRSRGKLSREGERRKKAAYRARYPARYREYMRRYMAHRRQMERAVA